MIHRSKRSRAARGAAAVEMALSMLVFIPVFMYAIFLDDLLRYSLDAQEAALSTAWDFTVQDYTKPLKKAGSTSAGPRGGDSVVQKQARLMFCDHESGFDRYTAMSPVQNPDGSTGMSYADCVDTDHHLAVVAHVCWLNDKAKQVTCEDPETGAGNLGVPVHNQFMSAFTNGGLIRCSARAVVQNYLLPETFLPEFSKTKLTNKRWHNDTAQAIHDQSKEGTTTTTGFNGNSYFLAEEHLAILTDTWALTANANTMPGDKSGEMYERTANVYQNPQNVGYPIVLGMSASFFSQAASNNLLNPLVATMAASNGDVSGFDNPKSPNLAIAPQATGDSTTPSNRVTQEGTGRRYFNTEWRDWDQDNNRQTYQNRGVWYMGCKSPGTC